MQGEGSSLMHEASLVSNLIEKIIGIAADHDVCRIRAARIKLGALSHISPAHFRDHFRIASQGTVAEHVELDIQVATDTTAPDAHDIILISIDVDESPP